MWPQDCTAKEFSIITQSLPFKKVTNRIKQVLDAKFMKIDFKK